VECFQPGLFGGLIRRHYIWQRILQPIAFVFGVANVVVGIRSITLQPRIAPVQGCNPFRCSGYHLRPDERAAQPDGGRLPGQKIQVGEDSSLETPVSVLWATGRWPYSRTGTNPQTAGLVSKALLAGPARWYPGRCGTLRPCGLQQPRVNSGWSIGSPR